MKNWRCSMIAPTKHHHPVHCTPAFYTGGSGFISQSWGEPSWNRFFCFSSVPPCNCWIVPESRPQPFFPHPFQHVVKESSYHPILNCLKYWQCDYTEHIFDFSLSTTAVMWALPHMKSASARYLKLCLSPPVHPTLYFLLVFLGT
jgi:hypothetical protein